MVAVLLVAIPAVLGPLTVVHLELEWFLALQTCV
jgi:hypothetical protein